MLPELRLHPEVTKALDENAPIVVLESAVITSGLPREPLPATSRIRAAIQSGGPVKVFSALTGWNLASPVNLELALAMQRTVRHAGATPATIAIINGELRIGLSDDDVQSLAANPNAGKASVTDLAHFLTNGATAGTTVSATLAACDITHAAPGTHHPALRVFSTGGIGGVHRHWQHHLDVSADLRQIAHTPVCVVSSGAKSILDLPATLETLEALGVPVIGWQADHFPQFFSSGTSTLPLTRRVNTIEQAAALCRAQWNTLHRNEGILLCNPPPSDFALNAAEIEAIITQAEALAAQRNMTGPARTPFLLAELAQRTNGRSLDANIALLLNNAKLAAELAVALAQHPSARRAAAR